MKENKILAAIRLAEGTDRDTCIEEVKRLCELGADGIIVYDEAVTDACHEENIHIIKLICESIEIPVYGAAPKSLEDVKKLLYAGCEGVSVNAADPGLLEEAIKRFGTPKEALPTPDANASWDSLKTLDNGLVPCIVQDATDGTVLMMAYMNKESYEATLTTGRMTYFSRSRNKLWMKGEESGHFQYLKSLTTDCDRDTLLATVKQIGPACHTGARSCFFNNIVGEVKTGCGTNDVLAGVYDIIMERKSNPKEGSYTNYLFDKGIDKVLKKIGEESSEIIIAAKNPEREEIIYEVADFLYHVSVLMAMKDVTWEEIAKELENR